MAKLIPLSEWRQRTFDEPRPSLRACQQWAKEGRLRGEGVYSLTPEAAENYRQTGGVWAYVEPAEWLAQWDAAHSMTITHKEATA